VFANLVSEIQIPQASGATPVRHEAPVLKFAFRPWRTAGNSGEPLLRCFDCERATTLEHLTLFPWWEPHIQAFDAMHRCERCLPRAHKRLVREIGASDAMLTSFIEFAQNRISPASVGPASDTLAAACQVLDALLAHRATVRRGSK
jgi:hypothetical protein